MQLDPSESVNNMGTLRVDVLDAADLPSADRNGFSDPYCKFELNGESIYKTKVQKKTLHPAWNEFFETPIRSRTAANFRVRVMDWDFGEKADLLGSADINLEMLDPMLAQEVTLALDGKSGALRLKLLFKSSYVTRTRQGSSTFSGTVGPAGKIIGAPVKGVGKVGGALGGGVVRGATFLRHGFKGSKEHRDISGSFAEPPTHALVTNGDSAPIPSIETPIDDSTAVDGSAATPGFVPSPHSRTTSFGGKSVASVVGGTVSKPDAGTAFFTILSAAGYPTAAKIQVHVKQATAKGHKEVHKTKGIKTSSGEVQWENEGFKVNCPPDAQFTIHVKDDKMFKDEELGEAPFFIDDSQSGSEKTVKVGDGTVTVKSSFMVADSVSATSSPRAAVRKSFLGKRDSSRQGTPA